MYAQSIISAIALSAMIGAALPLRAQTSAPDSVPDLRPPSTPAFVLLGVEPTSVTQPSSPRALATWGFTQANEGGVIPQNLAMEVAPFWLVSRPSFTFEEYFQEGSSFAKTVGITAARSFALSAASAPRIVASDTLGSSLGFGARVILWPGRAPTGLMDQKNRLVAQLGACSTRDNPGPCFDSTAVLRDSVRSRLEEPVGFVMQLSGGLSFDSPSDSLRDVRRRRSGVWISPTYRTERRVDLIFVGRYLRDAGDSANATPSNLYDAGMRLTWRPSERFALSAEGLHRWETRKAEEDNTTPRWGGMVEYRARNDWYLFYSFGKDFAAANVPRSPLFARLGLSLGFGQKPAVAVP